MADISRLADGAAPSSCTPKPAFHLVYRTWYVTVSRWVRALGGPASDVEDLTQEVFLVVHRRLHEFDGRNLGGWLYQITRHKVRDLRRTAWWKSRHGVQQCDELKSPGPDPAHHMELRDEVERLSVGLAALTASERTALLMLELDGSSGEEISDLHGTNLNTTWSRIRRARMKLKRLPPRSNRQPNANAAYSTST